MGLDYRWANLKWESIKPIRGRAVDVRPLGRRHRDWELIRRREQFGSQPVYALRYHNTDCVEYHPNGDIVLFCGGWHTVTTGQFMSKHSPVWVWKQNNVLWVRCYPEGPVYPLPSSKGLRFARGENGRYKPVDKVTITKRVVDRPKAKAAREHVQPFLQWAKTFLTLSDGWVMHETLKQSLGWATTEAGVYYYPDMLIDRRNQFNLIQTLREEQNAETYLQLLCSFVASTPNEEREIAETIEFDRTSMNRYRLPQQFYDHRTTYTVIYNHVYRLIQEFGDVYKTVEVEPTDKVQLKVVQNA